MIERNYLEIKKFLDLGRSIMVLGPRGTGKTYFLTRLLNHYPHTRSIDFLNKQTFRRYLRNPDLIYKEVSQQLSNLSQPLIILIDEVQLLPSILDEVQRTIEKFKPKVIFVLTGSSARKLKRYDANLLAGRCIKIDFFPLGLDEIDFNAHLDFLLQWGSLPESFVLEQEDLRLAYLQTYVGIYLEEEIQREARLRDLSSFSRFLELSAAENGSCVNFSKLSRAVGIADVTVKEYFQILVDTLLAYRLPAWSYSKREQLQKASKYYLFDNGVVNALLGELKTLPTPSSYRYGRLFENLVIGQIYQQAAKRRSPLKFYHYRSMSGAEIDLIVQKNPYSPPIAVEIKSSEAPQLVDVRELTAFKNKYPDSKQLVICRTPVDYQEDGIEFLSLTTGIKRIFEIDEKRFEKKEALN